MLPAHTRDGLGGGGGGLGQVPIQVPAVTGKTGRVRPPIARNATGYSTDSLGSPLSYIYRLGKDSYM